MSAYLDRPLRSLAEVMARRDREPHGCEHRPIYEIAREIRRDWPRPYFGAVPYLDAMFSLDRMTDAYGADSGKSVVIYFLSNATTWRGDVARRIKAELNAILKAK